MTKQKLIRTYILDDSIDATECLQLLLETNFSVKVVGTSSNPHTAIEEVKTLLPDLIFTDVEMPDMSGVQFCSEVKPFLLPNTKVVFYTGYDKYLKDALHQGAFDYLLKPPTLTEVSQIVMRFYEDKLSNLAQANYSAGGRTPDVLVINSANEHVVLRPEDIAFFRFNKDRKLWEVVCGDRECYLLRSRTNADIILRFSGDFVQIHKSYIINVRYINKIQEQQCLLVPPLDDITEVKVSKNFRRSLIDAFYAM